MLLDLINLSTLYAVTGATASGASASRPDRGHREEAPEGRHQRPAADHRRRARRRRQDRRVHVGAAGRPESACQLREGKKTAGPIFV